MNDSSIDGGMAVASVLDAVGVETVFTLTGGHISPVLEGCEDLGINVIDTRHEASAGFMAAAWGVMKREPGICLVTAGPGHTNAYSAFTQAFEAGYPTLSLSGQYELEAEGLGALQEVNQVAMVDEVAKWARQADTPDRLVEYTEEAIRQATTPPFSHTHVSLPRDVLSTERQPEEFPITDLNPDLSTPAQAGDEETITQAVSTLVEAERPVIIVGGGAWFTDAGKQLREFIEYTGAPVFTHEEARGLVPDSHELCFGSPLYKLNGASRQISDADCVLLLDVSLDWRMDYGEPPMLPDTEKATFIQVSPVPEQVGDKLNPDVGIVADVRTALKQFIEASSDYDWNQPNEWLNRLSTASSEFKAKYQDALTSDQVPVHPGRLANELAEAITDQTRVVFDGGNIGKWGKFAIDAELPGRWLRLKGPFACIGYGLPTALAVKLAEPDDNVVLLTGDGAFGYNVMEIETAVRNDLPITIVIANNGAWGSVGGEEAPVGTTLPNAPFHELARDFGALGELVTEPESVRPALHRALESDDPYCVNVHTSNPYAPVDYPKTLKGY